MPASFSQICRWDTWANRQVLETLRASGGEPPAALAAFQHAVAAEYTWLCRLDGDGDAFYSAWPEEPSFAQAETWYAWTSERLPRLAEQLDAGYGAETLTYRTSRGQEFSDIIDNVLLHMFMHSSQYRGEASGFLNAAGYRVPELDLMFWTRSGEPA